MEAHNGDESVKFSGKSEGLPDSPAETNRKVLFVAILLKHFHQVNEGVSHLLLIQALCVWHYFLHIGGISSIDFGEDFWEVDVIAPVGVGISDGLMATSESAKYISEDDEDSLPRANVIDIDVIELEYLAVGVILHFKSGPRAWRTASVGGFVALFLHQSQKSIFRSNWISR